MLGILLYAILAAFFIPYTLDIWFALAGHPVVIPMMVGFLIGLVLAFFSSTLATLMFVAYLITLVLRSFAVI